MSKQTTIGKPGGREQSKFRMGQDYPERKSRHTTGRQGASRCKVQRQKVGQVTGAETRRRSQWQKPGQVPGNPSGTDCLRVVYDYINLAE